MFNHTKWQLLQLFGGEGAGSSGASAGEGSGAAAAPTGENSVDAGHQRLLELGVPASKIRKPRAKQASPLPEGAIRTQQQVQQPQAQEPQKQDAAANNQNAQTENAPTRMSWEEIKNDPEYKKEIQKIIQARVKDEGQNKAILETLAPALKQLAQENGLDPENLDYAALVKTITGDYEKKAVEMGTTVETVRMLDQQQRTLEQQKKINHFMKVKQQEQALKTVYPNFDLNKEMQNPVFARMTSPEVGLPLEVAFHAVHYKENQIQSMQVAAQQATQMISNAIQSGTHRPDETGTASQAPSVSQFNYKNATPAQRKALKEEIRRAAAEGRKIYPG